ncbi:hypothetical protein G6F50_018112 [Rhizopus delemar]|uniref:Uncharacterized protein n=1 Tax=Rhizopus delemar TaxID=936053 RepID=A0A9P6XNM3_9FUNG|nr:hypothetical protein G6F50_018112 [Rhizopus delemar]
MRPYLCLATVRPEQFSDFGSGFPLDLQDGTSRAPVAARPVLARLPLPALDVAVQPLTPAEIQQVSGGIGSIRSTWVGAQPPSARPANSGGTPVKGYGS